MDLMRWWIRSSAVIKHVEFVPNYISYDFVSKGKIILLKNLVVLACGLPHCHLLTVFWIKGKFCESVVCLADE